MFNKVTLPLHAQAISCDLAVKESYLRVWVIWWEVYLFARNTSVSNTAAGAFSAPVSSSLCFSFVWIIKICPSTSLVLSWFIAGLLEVQVIYTKHYLYYDLQLAPWRSLCKQHFRMYKHFRAEVGSTGCTYHVRIISAYFVLYHNFLFLTVLSKVFRR